TAMPSTVLYTPSLHDALPISTYDIFGIRYGGGTLMLNSSNNHGASDFQWRSNSAQMYPEVTIYTKPSTDIFTDPDNANFKIKDNGFPGRENAGDPRWRM